MSKNLDIKKIKNPHILNFLFRHNIRTESQLLSVKGRDKNLLNERKFNRHCKDFHFPFGIDKVWSAYKNMAPDKMWRGNLLDFGISRNAVGEVQYKYDSHEGAQKGDVIILDVKFFKGLLHTVTGHELLEVNSHEKFIETSYINLTTTTGFQKISLRADDEHNTIVSHESVYSIDSRLKKLFYPILHARVITLFHQNVHHYLLTLPVHH